MDDAPLLIVWWIPYTFSSLQKPWTATKLIDSPSGHDKQFPLNEDTPRLPLHRPRKNEKWNHQNILCKKKAEIKYTYGWEFNMSRISLVLQGNDHAASVTFLNTLRILHILNDMKLTRSTRDSANLHIKFGILVAVTVVVRLLANKSSSTNLSLKMDQSSPPKHNSRSM